jgi:hypothetical protein
VVILSPVIPDEQQDHSSRLSTSTVDQQPAGELPAA